MTYGEKNTKIWSNPATAEDLGYGEVKYPLQPLIHTSAVDQNFKKYIFNISAKKKKKEKISIIDFGGGNGRKYYFLKKEIFKNIPFTYTVVDINPLCIKAGREHFKNNKDVKFIYKNVKEFEPSMYYDIGIMDSTLSYVAEPYVVLHRLYSMCYSLLLLRVPMALPTHPSYYLNKDMEGYNFRTALSAEDESLSHSYLLVESRWGEEQGASYVFSPGLYGLLYSHPKTKSLSYGVKKSGPEIQGVSTIPEKEAEDKPSWRENFSIFLNTLVDNLDKNNSKKPENYLQDHKSEYVGKFECEFFVERRQ
jgi:putative methyltransferase (TIGR04325 family)